MPSPIDLLTEAGLAVRSPPVRSSDEVAIDNPWIYYITRRLSIVPSLPVRSAMVRGTNLHLLLRHLTPTGVDMPAAQDEFDATLQETLDRAAAAGYSSDALTQAAATARGDFQNHTVWFEAASTIQIPLFNLPLPQLLYHPDFTILGRELTVQHTTPDNLTTLIQIDLLLLSRLDNTLWIVDLKSTESSPYYRLLHCPTDFQTHLYLSTLDQALHSGALDNLLNIPSLCPAYDDRAIFRSTFSVGGMIHLALKVPSLRLSNEDRPFEEYEHTLLRGPRTGEVEIRRRYLSDTPSPLLFRDRCVRWYKAEGEYSHLATERAIVDPASGTIVPDPPINVSHTYWAALKLSLAHAHFNHKLRDIHAASIRNPYPEVFPYRNPVTPGQEPSPYLAFMTTPIPAWPDLMRVKRLIVLPRETSPPTIISPLTT